MTLTFNTHFHLQNYFSVSTNFQATGYKSFLNIHYFPIDQRTNGPVNAHPISWPSKAQNKQNLENIW